uniref:Uncharacterized protein n=1 Tax=Nelumbo nucifera TaxID=4432 RepID=A0A822ZK64_NELNU|nr:TPA_asm: hypothetical protein HUJ06_003497 [Nelumbo nucifera]
MHNITSLQEFRIQECPRLVAFPHGGLPTNLWKLQVVRSEELKSLPAEGIHNIASLQELRIQECPRLVAFPNGGLPTNNLTWLTYHTRM